MARPGIVLTVLLCASAGALHAANPPDWTEPFPPFQIAGNLYYVGSKGLANYLVVTPQGHILINSDLEESVPLIRASVEKLGFKFEDIRILLISHAHWDHDGGSDTIKKLTGAKYMVMDADVPVVESGGKADFNYGGDVSTHVTPTRVDRVLHDGDEVSLGSAVLTAHLTPGHTRGCTTWTMKVQDGGRTYDVVIVGGPWALDSYRLLSNAQYPQIAADFEKTFRVLKSLPCDIFLGAHGSYFDMEAKHAHLEDGGGAAFADPGGYTKLIADAEQAFKKKLAEEQARARATILDKVPARPDPEARYVIYLHGKAVEEQGRRPTHPQWGVYEYDQILEALASGGVIVISEQRPADTDMQRFAEHVVDQVRQLERGGVAPERITVAGFSKGGGIAVRTSNLLRDPRVNFVFLAACGNGDFDGLDLKVAGRILSIYEANDEVGRSCRELFAKPGVLGKRSEIEVAVGDHHGTFYRTHREWLDPLLQWVRMEDP